MRSNNDFEIPFEGLKLGKHSFKLLLTETFFADQEFSIIENGLVELNFELDKRENMMVGVFEFEGFVEVLCDRCTTPLKVEVSDSYQIVFKFGEEISDDESLIIIQPNEFKIDLKPICHELIAVSIPAKNTHDEGDCDESVLRILDKYTKYNNDEEDDDGPIDPRWEALNKVK